MDKTELIKQYDRFIDQLRTEVKDLYWLYNFFFLIESALLGLFSIIAFIVMLKTFFTECRQPAATCASK